METVILKYFVLIFYVQLQYFHETPYSLKMLLFPGITHTHGSSEDTFMIIVNAFSPNSKIMANIF